MGKIRGLYIGLGGPAEDENTPNFIPAPTLRVSDRRGYVQTPIWAKSRTTRSARRAGRFYLTSIMFREHFSTPHKIIRLLNKRGFDPVSDGWSCAGCDGARVNPGVAKVVCRGG